jgi:hypothetical protein
VKRNNIAASPYLMNTMFRGEKSFSKSLTTTNVEPKNNADNINEDIANVFLFLIM